MTTTAGPVAYYLSRRHPTPTTPNFLSGISIRATIAALFAIQGVELALDRNGAPNPAQLSTAVHRVRRLLVSPKLRAMQQREVLR